MQELIFWLIMLAILLIAPGTMIFFGRRFLEKPPKKINSTYGYRTARSIKSQAAWDFAHQECGRVWKRLGAVMIPVSAAAFLPALWADISAIGYWSLVIVVVQCVVMLCTFIPVERALKRHFDEFGRKRA